MRFKAKPVAPWCGKPAWEAQYLLHGKWRTVKNQHGLKIIYMTAEAALYAAEFTYHESWKGGQ